MASKVIRKFVSVMFVIVSVASLIATADNAPNKSGKNSNYAFPLTKVNK